MASSSTQKPSSSSAPTGKFNFDVFLSFRGEDTRYNFTDHLFQNLKRMGINTFRDDELERGEEIAQELLGAIEGSRFSIIVFSERYADSKWCLDELTKIMECKKEMDQIVLPVFYHVHPSDHGTTVDEEKVKRWRAAMTEASSLSGWHVIKDYEYESKYIEEILEVIRKRLGPKHLHVGDDIVGMDSRLEELKSLINSQLHDVCVVGIYGTGGIGKTTIAKIVYNEIQCEFNGASFLENVKESFKKGCQLQLQQKLLHGIVGQKIELSSIDDGLNIIKNRLGSKREQLESLVGSRNWFGAGTTIIVTTRDQHLLRIYGVDDPYEVRKLHYMEAIQLFSKHAFKQNAPKENYVNLSKCIVDYAQGLPLALKVLGSSLHGKTIDEWKSASNKLKNNLKKEINDVLRISFDMLDCLEKKVFLDIACFFKEEDKAFVSKILDDCDYEIGVLCDKCLITISKNMIQMHELIQQMGWTIVREECPGEPSKWSRLWDLDDINKAFSRGKGMENIETMSLDLSKAKEMWLSSKALTEMKKVSAMMQKLRLLKVYYNDHHSSRRKEYKVFLPKDFELPPNLIYLHWEGYASNFCKGEELKFIDLSYSQQLIKIPEFSRMPKLEKLNLEGCTSFHNLDSSVGALHDMRFLWKLCLTKFLRTLNFSETRIKELPSSIGSLAYLEMLNLSGCSKFKKFPDIFANMGHLRELDLHNSGIKELPSSIGFLTSLEILDLMACSKFEKFPDIFANLGHLRKLQLDGTGIKELPSSIRYLESLETLSLTYCSNFENFPEIPGINMKCLKRVFLDGMAIKEVPKGIWCLEALENLSFQHCSNLEKLPEFQRNMGSMKYLDVNGTAIKELPSSIRHLTGLKILCLNNSAIKELPFSIQHLTQLQYLQMRNCKNLTSLPNNIYRLKSLREWHLDGCSNLEVFPEIMEDMENLQVLDLCELAIKELPSSIERLKSLELLELNNCDNLETLPSSLGNLTSLCTLRIHNCPKLHKLFDFMRNLQCRLTELDVGGCNLMEGSIHSDIGCLFSLKYLTVSDSNICCIPVDIIQLSQLNALRMNHCPMLEEILELPSSLRRIEAHGCPCLETLSSNPRHLLWSYLINCFKSQIQDFVEGYYDSDKRDYLKVVIPGRSGIPEWVSHKSMGREIRIELPKNWYEDKNFLGFSLFFHHIPLDDDDDICKTIYDCSHPCDSFHVHTPELELQIFHGDQFEQVDIISFVDNCKTRSIYGSIFHVENDHKGSTSPDPALRVAYFPQIAISSKCRSSGWNNFKARFQGLFGCGDKVAFKVESCGIHLIYDDAQDHHQQSLRLFNVKRSHDDIEDHPHHKKSRHV
ncbi:hypothetical protein AAG906_000445 [Vitis piasezkii]